MWGEASIPLKIQSIKPCLKEVSTKMFNGTSLISKFHLTIEIYLLEVGLVKSTFSSIYVQ